MEEKKAGMARKLHRLAQEVLAMYAHLTKENHKSRLELRPIRPSGKSHGVLDEADAVHLYEVVGLPQEEQVWIADMNGNWQISHTKNGVLGEWVGNYKSAEDALGVLQRNIEKVKTR